MELFVKGPAAGGHINDPAVFATNHMGDKSLAGNNGSVGIDHHGLFHLGKIRR